MNRGSLNLRNGGKFRSSDGFAAFVHISCEKRILRYDNCPRRNVYVIGHMSYLYLHRISHGQITTRVGTIRAAIRKTWSHAGNELVFQRSPTEHITSHRAAIYHSAVSLSSGLVANSGAATISCGLSGQGDDRERISCCP